ncbi:hypothetical protein Glove_21g167 [Diversispora epigaea]|uniref:Uncharacterized protein n=1 Tax=Diversispora epigaea TaxID=1348612 RepID=A0A397JLJ6_9GLOM|nr:hypothetical protein Glove_21g167 [Diversispora epigaea]
MNDAIHDEQPYVDQSQSQQIPFLPPPKKFNIEVELILILKVTTSSIPDIAFPKKLITIAASATATTSSMSYSYSSYANSASALSLPQIVNTRPQQQYPKKNSTDSTPNYLYQPPQPQPQPQPNHRKNNSINSIIRSDTLSASSTSSNSINSLEYLRLNHTNNHHKTTTFSHPGDHTHTSITSTLSNSNAYQKHNSLNTKSNDGGNYVNVRSGNIQSLRIGQPPPPLYQQVTPRTSQQLS